MRNLYEADISISSSGDNEIIAADPSHRIYIWKLWAVANAAVNLKFKHGSTEFNATAIPLTAQGSNFAFAYDGVPYWKTLLNESFVINLSGAQAVSGRIYYSYE